MTFLEKIKSSIYNPTFYRQIPKETFRSALTYYLLLCLFLTVLRVVFLAIPITSGVNQLTNNLDKKVMSAYPQDLEVTIHKGVVQTNAQEPYYIPLSDTNSRTDKNQNDNENSAERKNIVVIDTKTPFSEKQFDTYNTYVWISRDTIFYKNNNKAEVRAYDLSSIKDFTLNKNIVRNSVDKISPWLKFLIPAILILAFVGLYFIYLLKLIYLLLLALIFWLIAKKLMPGLSYGNSYKVALHAITLGMLLDVFLGVTTWLLHIHGFPFLGTLLAIVVFVVNIRNVETVKVVKKASVPRKKKK